MHKAMHRRPLDTHCTALLAGAGAGAALAHLDLSGNTLGDAGAAALAAALHDNTALTLLGLHANGVGDEGAAALATALPVAVLRYVGLNMNRVGDRGATALAGAVAGLPLTSGRGTTAGYKGRPPSVTAVPQHPCPPKRRERPWARPRAPEAKPQAHSGACPAGAMHASPCVRLSALDEQAWSRSSSTTTTSVTRARARSPPRSRAATR